VGARQLKIAAEKPEFQQRLTAPFAMIIAILIAAIFWMAG